jgi:ABC-2 type transport system ATP-binding protein
MAVLAPRVAGLFRRSNALPHAASGTDMMDGRDRTKARAWLAGKLSGGQQAQLALTLALARRPRLLVLDEPVAMLDPVARHDFMATVLAAATADGVSVLLSSHVLTELERVAGYLVLMSRGRVRLAGEVAELLAAHRQASLEELAMAYLRENLPEVTR